MTTLDIDSTARTRALARIAGPYFAIMGGYLFVRRAELPAVFGDFMRDGALILITGAFTLILGLTIIAFHHHWTRPISIALSLVGWGAALKGAMLVLAPDVGADMSDAFLRTPQFVYVASLAMLLLGVWFTLTGWSRTRT